MKCFLFIFFLFTPLCRYMWGKRKKICIQNEKKKKNWHTDLSAITVYVCNAFGSLNNMRCYYLRKTVHRLVREREKKMLVDPWQSAETRMCGDFCARAL